MNDHDSDYIDFLKFSRQYIKVKKETGKNASAATFLTVYNNLVDYLKTDSINISEINSKFLTKFEKYLRSPRTIKRPSNKGKIVEYEKEGVSDAGLHNQMRDLRLLFNACRNEYNDEDLGIIRIKHYPFKKYKVGQAPETENRNLTIEEIKAIRDSEAEPGSRAELARDLFMLSFYLCGMNAADLYRLKPGKVHRVNYNRSKTAGRRKDKAFISVKLIPEAEVLYYKYAGKLQERYTSEAQLNAALNKGMPAGIDFYSARHSFGDLARNTCRFSVDDVGIAMNHKDRANKTTDIYISKNWNIVDEVQAAVVELLL
jgi:integrase